MALVLLEASFELEALAVVEPDPDSDILKDSERGGVSGWRYKLDDL